MFVLFDYFKYTFFGPGAVYGNFFDVAQTETHERKNVFSYPLVIKK